MFFKRLAAFVLTCAWAGVALSAPWPNQPVRFIVPFPAGGSTDVPARLLAERLGNVWGQPVVVENRPGAAGAIGAAEVARAEPNGYTLLIPAGAIMTANQHMYSDLIYNPDVDFVPVTTVASGPYVLVVPADSPYISLEDFLTGAKSNPGKLNFGHAGVGSQSHLAVEGFVSAAGIDAVSVPYKGDPPALVDLAAGLLDFSVANIAAAITHIQGGRVRAIGVSTAEEVVQLPGVPPIKQFVDEFETSGWVGVVAPAGTPDGIIQKISDDVRMVMQDPTLKQRFAELGVSPVGNTPQEMKVAIAFESARMKELVTRNKLAAR